jgi:hypothetical protein
MFLVLFAFLVEYNKIKNTFITFDCQTWAEYAGSNRSILKRCSSKSNSYATSLIIMDEELFYQENHGNLNIENSYRACVLE